jgi:hypothetical protein
MSKKMNKLFNDAIPSTIHSSSSLDIKPKSLSNLYKWVPLLCAGAAAGVSIIALKELKNVRKELVTLKTEKFQDTGLHKRMENLEDQIKMISEYIKNGTPQHYSPPPPQPQFYNKNKVKKEDTVIKNVVPEQKKVTIINEPEDMEEGVEYEEIEVTDDEEE